jgi:glycine/D-amino acid oxidase-like deaminating enzyme
MNYSDCQYQGGHTKAASYRSYPSNASNHSVADANKIARLEIANINATHSFASAHNVSCESRPCRTVDAIYCQEAFDAGVKAIETIKQNLGEDDEAADYNIFNAEEARGKFLVDGDVKGAFEYPAGSISAYKFVCGVLKLCLEKGLNLQTFTPVESVSSTASAEAEETIWTAKTSRGDIKTKKLILATNGYTAHLLPKFLSKIIPLRGQITAHRPGPKLAQLRPKGLETTYSFIYSNGYEYMIPRPQLPSVPSEFEGDIIIGGGLGALPERGESEFGETDDTVLNPLTTKYLTKCTKRYFGKNWGDDVESERVRKEWSGIMGVTGDGLPFVGEVPGSKGLWISGGFNGHGQFSWLLFRILVRRTRC